MKKCLSVGTIFLGLLFELAFFAGCKKNGSSPVPSTTIQPQQNKIIYFSYVVEANKYEIWVSDYDGSNNGEINIDLPVNVKIAGYTPPIMSLDDKKIYFDAALTDGGTSTVSSGIYSCNFDGSNVQGLITNSNPDSIPVISSAFYSGSQGKILYQYISYQGASVFTANLDGSGQQKINITMPTNSYIEFWHPAIASPDGENIFFSVSLTNSSVYNNIYSCSINGGNITAVTTSNPGSANILGGIYSIGKQGKILFYNSMGAGSLQTANLDGTDVQIINTALYYGAIIDAAAPRISPDGKMVFFNTIESDDEEAFIYSCNIGGSNLKPMLIPTAIFDHVVVGQAF